MNEFERLLAESTAVPATGDTITGTVVLSDQDGLWIAPDAPAPSELFVEAQDLAKLETHPALGDTASAVVTAFDAEGDGILRGSIAAAVKVSQLPRLIEAMASGETLHVKLVKAQWSSRSGKRPVLAGYIAEYNGFRIFIPRRELVGTKHELGDVLNVSVLASQGKEGVIGSMAHHVCAELDAAYDAQTPIEVVVGKASHRKDDGAFMGWGATYNGVSVFLPKAGVTTAPKPGDVLPVLITVAESTELRNGALKRKYVGSATRLGVGTAWAGFAGAYGKGDVIQVETFHTVTHGTLARVSGVPQVVGLIANELLPAGQTVNATIKSINVGRQRLNLKLS